MKKFILSLMALSMFVAVGCSEESATDYNAAPAEEQNNLFGRSSVWNGVIGIEDNGLYKVTADEAALMADLETNLKREGHDTKLQTLEIVKKESANTPGDFGYMLVGADKVRTSIGVWLVRSNNQFTIDTGFTNSTSCTGCAMGCNLSYMTIDGKKLAYCNENGCDYDCTKSETSVF